MNKTIKVWKVIEEEKISLNQYLINLKKKGVILSPWIFNIFKLKKNKLKISKGKYYLYRISVRNLGFKKATKLKNIYAQIKKRGFFLVPPDVALRTRLHYKEQKTGEWLRFASPLNSMIDIDGVPHLPKLGRALGKFFIETYWSYPNAIFHPHNEFIITKKK
jgi:hypothetical protein